MYSMMSTKAYDSHSSTKEFIKFNRSLYMLGPYKASLADKHMHVSCRMNIDLSSVLVILDALFVGFALLLHACMQNI